ncbi:hypothetical protein ALC53_10403 [Atta colombica]|uniref:Uncharacterized protein n=1 Tax=Atta colombica TaxID=520822 RepID=A0A195B4P4_9HYME|nr:hypothetical protein ALC53_10403 [Atta colombica]
MCRAENGLSRKSRVLNERGRGSFTLIMSVSERDAADNETRVPRAGGNSTLRRRERRVPRTTRGIFTRLVEAFIDARGNSYELLQSAGIKSTETSNVTCTQEEWRGLAKRSHSQLSQLVDLSRHSSAKGSRRFPRDNNGREQRKKWAA